MTCQELSAGLIFRPAIAGDSPECAGAGFTASGRGRPSTAPTTMATASPVGGAPSPRFSYPGELHGIGPRASVRGCCRFIGLTTTASPLRGLLQQPGCWRGAFMPSGYSPRFSHGQAGIKPSGLATSGHVDQLRHVGGAHLVHDVGAVNLHRARADAQIPGDLLAGETGYRQRHALLLA
jgi:hypothetical protein